MRRFGDYERQRGLDATNYSVIEYRGFYYIKAKAGAPAPPQIGPYRYEADARRIAEQFNKPSQESAAEKENRNRGKNDE